MFEYKANTAISLDKCFKAILLDKCFKAISLDKCFKAIPISLNHNEQWSITAFGVQNDITIINVFTRLLTLSCIEAHAQL